MVDTINNLIVGLDTKLFYINNETEPSISFSVSNDSLTVTITDVLLTGNYNSVFWDFGDGNTSSLPSPSHTYNKDTLFNVCMKIYTSSQDSCEFCHVLGKDAFGNVVRSAGFNLNVRNSVTGISQLIQEDASAGETIRQNAALIEVQSGRMAQIIRQLLDFARRSSEERKLANAQVADIEWHGLVAQTVAEAMKRYYDVVFTLRNMEVQREGVDLAQKLMDDTQKRSNEGVAAANDVMVAESGVSQRREEALAAEMQYIERQNALQMLFKSAGEVIAQGSRIQPVDGMSETVPATNREALMATAVERRYEIKQANAVIMAKSAQVDFARNQAKPRIDLVANGGYHGLAGNFGDSYSRAADGQGPEWSIGMQVSIPLGLNNMKAVRRAAEDQRTQAHVQLDKTKLRVALEVDTVLSRLRMDVQRLEATKKSREAAAQSAEGELKRLTEGVSTSYQVLQLQKEFSQARSRELAALADINKDIVDLQLTTGTLLEEQDVVVESTAAATRNEFDGVPAVTNPVRDQWLAGPEAVMPDNAAMSDNAVMPDNAAMPDKAAKPPVPAKSVKAKTASPSASRIK